ncbi:MAG: HlyD family efflux transporter periplasmic adaptor subunit [Planctomycetaceae bacterium]
MTRLWNILGESFHVLAPVAMVAIGIGGFMVFGQRPETPPREINHNVVAAVESAGVEQADGSFTIELDGVALSYRQVTHAAQVAGEVVEKVEQCRSGHYVSEGQYLLQIDPTNFQLEVERLQVQIEQADANLKEADIEIENAESLIELAKEDLELQKENLNRVKQLMTRGASTDTQLDAARKQELTARNSLRTLQNQLAAVKQRKITLESSRKLSETQLKRAKVDLDRTKVTAPIAGTLITVSVEEGDYVKAGDPLFRTNDSSTMEVSCQLRVEELYWVWLQAGNMKLTDNTPSDLDLFGSQLELPNVPVEVAFDFRGVEYLWDGVLSRYDGTGLDPATRTVPCRVRVDEPTKVRVGGNGVAGRVAPPTLFSGMYVKVRIPVASPVPMLKVPLPAIRPNDEVWVVQDGTLHVMTVDVARFEGNSVLLIAKPAGLQAGDRVITSPLAAVEEGMSVEDLGQPEDESEVAVLEADGPSDRTPVDQSSELETETAADSTEVQP